MARKGYKTASFTLPDGKRKYVYAKTKEELEEKVFQLKLQMRMGVKLDDDMALGELIQLWYHSEVEPKIVESTATNIKSVLNCHLMPLIGDISVKDVTPLQVKLWLNETGKLNKNAAKTCLRALRRSFELAEENGLVYKSPVLSRYTPGGAEFKKREALTPEEETLLLEATKGTRAYLFIWFALATGARRGEICGLKWDCVDFKKSVVHLKRNLVLKGFHEYELHDYLKTESSTRDVPLPYDLRDALQEELKTTNSVFVFHRPDGEPYTAASFRNFWMNVHRRFGPKAKQTSRTHGVITEAPVTPHVLRHTYATRCFEKGMDITEVQHLMGHANPNITLEIYTHYCEQSRQEATFNKARIARSRTTDVPRTGDKESQSEIKADKTEAI